MFEQSGDMNLEEARAKHLTLNMSRALGHRILSKFGVSSKPSMLTYTLPIRNKKSNGSVKAQNGPTGNVTEDDDIDTDYWLMLCSDGISDVLSLDERLEILDQHINELRLHEDPNSAWSFRNLHEISSAITTAAHQKWRRMGSGDNTTVVIVHIRDRCYNTTG
jgi:serine/threonine protein phosphatase PrpC